MLHISSLKLSYTGIYHNFHGPSSHPSHSQPLRPIKFTRLRRRPDDVRVNVNSPFVFYVYDAHLSGVLLSGMVLNPLDDHALVPPVPVAPPLPPALSLIKQSTNSFCSQFFQFTRKRVEISENILIPCLESYRVSEKFDNETSNLIQEYESALHPEYDFKFLTRKTTEKKFYFNERDSNANTSFFEIQGRIKYLSYPPFDMKVIQVKVSRSKAAYLLIPNERSGLSLIEEGIERVPFRTLLCQMRDINRRLRVPVVNVEVENIKVNELFAGFINSTNSSSVAATPGVIGDIPNLTLIGLIDEEGGSGGTAAATGNYEDLVPQDEEEERSGGRSNNLTNSHDNFKNPHDNQNKSPCDNQNNFSSDNH
jgi:hypothetical protein